MACPFTLRSIFYIAMPSSHPKIGTEHGRHLPACQAAIFVPTPLVWWAEAHKHITGTYLVTSFPPILSVSHMSNVPIAGVEKRGVRVSVHRIS